MSYFKEFPFTTAAPQIVDFWAGRKAVKKDVKNLVQTFKNTKQAQITTVWGAYGNGKTHTIKYIKYLFGDSCIFIYSPYSKAGRNFGELYKQTFIANYDFKQFGIACKRIYQEASKSKHVDDALDKIGTNIWGDGSGNVWYEFSNVVTQVGLVYDAAVNDSEAFRDERTRIAIRWLTGETITKPERHEIGVSSNAKADEQFHRLCYILIRLSNSKYGGNKPIVWALDDCQVIVQFDKEKMKPLVNDRAKSQVQQGIRTVFDYSHSGLLILLGLATADKDHISSIFVPDILSRLSPIKIELESFTDDLKEPLEFIHDIMNNEKFKLTAEIAKSMKLKLPKHKSEWYPFQNEKVVTEILEKILDASDAFTPRSIMKTFGDIVAQAQIKKLEEIDTKFIEKYFAAHE